MEKAVAETVGASNFTKVNENTITLRAGSTQVFIHMFEEEGPVRLQVFAPVIRNVGCTPELLQELNEINQAAAFAKVFWTEGEVLISTEILADALQKEGIDNALGVIASAADHFDAELKARFGGDTVFPKSEPLPTEPHGAGAGEGVGAPPGQEAREDRSYSSPGVPSRRPRPWRPPRPPPCWRAPRSRSGRQESPLPYRRERRSFTSR